MQFFASGSPSFHLMTDVVSGVFSVICTALFLRFVWHPKTRFLLKSERERQPAAATADGRQEGLEVPLHRRPDRLCVAALGDPHRLLRPVGHAGVEEDPERLVLRVTFNTTLLGSKFAARSRCRSGTCRRSTTSCSACRPWPP